MSDNNFLKRAAMYSSEPKLSTIMNKSDLKSKLASKTPSKQPLQLQTSMSAMKAASKTPMNDRYIPGRQGTNMEASYHLLHSSCSSNLANASGVNLHDASGVENVVDNLKRKLIIETCNGLKEKSKVLQLHSRQPTESDLEAAAAKILYHNSSSQVALIKKSAATRHVCQSPDRILDAPEFRDDYYLNLIDWSHNNHLAVALNQDMYVWNASNGEISHLFSMDQESSDYICSTAWIQSKGNILAVGNSKNVVELWDVNKQACIRQMKSQLSRVGSLAWNQHLLTSGSRSGAIHQHDVRIAQHHVGTYKHHEQEICGLKWSTDGRHLASGGNDNLVCIWDPATGNSHDAQPTFVFREHSAAVKALAWCPWQHNMLATGGGSSDKQIKIWNIYNGTVSQSIDAKSQVSCLLWSKHYKELISSHGHDQNQLTIWKYPEMTRVCDLNGHTGRVLMMTMSPDEEVVASVSADETIRLWKCFSMDEKLKRAAKENTSLIMGDKLSASYTSLSRSIR